MKCHLTYAQGKGDPECSQKPTGWTALKYHDLEDFKVPSMLCVIHTESKWT